MNTMTNIATSERGNLASAQAKEAPMAVLLSSSDLAIAEAIAADTIRVNECFSERLQEAYWAIEDHHGLIEVALSADEADARIAAIKGRLQ